ncbi:DDE-type integrase/transposase/recombinase [Kitasatospora cineracea]|uniref:DDE-type integrase/transposase/recombinase n=1 Tax=Kitasatospora cineracea TaxID=88074 RepID=UPI00341CD691
MSITEGTGKKKPRPRRSFTPEFRAEIVELCRRGDRPAGQVAKDFGLAETAVRLWASQAEPDTGEGWLHLATVIGLASRWVIGQAAADHLRAGPAADALRAACRTRRPKRPVIFRSDCECQYASREFGFLVGELGARLSPSRVSARRAIFKWAEGRYNMRRPHRSLGRRSPAEYETTLAA